MQDTFLVKTEVMTVANPVPGTQTIQRTNQNSANSCSRRREQENVSATIGFGCASDWMTKWHKIFSQSCNVLMKTQNCENANYFLH